MYRSIILPHFKRQLKPYAKKHPHIKDALIVCLGKFEKSLSDSLGHRLYKLRIKVPGLKKGKSKGFRLILYLLEKEKLIVPVTIYFKGDKESMMNTEINEHLEIILFELQ